MARHMFLVLQMNIHQEIFLVKYYGRSQFVLIGGDIIGIN
jgi:hypothetical protein